jgi:hypothetical protein
MPKPKYKLNLPKLRKLANEIKEATEKERREHFWDTFDLDKFFEETDRIAEILAEERKKACICCNHENHG